MEELSAKRRDTRLKLLCVLAHPDDESLAMGGILAKYGAEGIETFLVTATRGERGWFGPPDEYPGPAALGEIRERELREAATVLGIRQVVLLDYLDGEVAGADQGQLVRDIAGHVRRIRPDVVATFDHNGIYGHPDHIAVTRATTAAMVAAAVSSFDTGTGDAPHTVSKLYHFAWTQEVREAFERAFGELRMEIDGAEREAVPWPHWAVSTWVDTSAYWEGVWEAIRCHRSQLPGYQKLLDLPPEYHTTLWGRLTFHRAYTLVPTNDKEEDLFDGLRERRA
ncbi:MAG: PIG-L family deacetylase [Chloroflexi bacterium]|nr:PIG-L family deacetylase [Chloroflexota bacterium]